MGNFAIDRGAVQHRINRAGLKAFEQQLLLLRRVAVFLSECTGIAVPYNREAVERVVLVAIDGLRQDWTTAYHELIAEIQKERGKDRAVVTRRGTRGQVNALPPAAPPERTVELLLRLSHHTSEALAECEKELRNVKTVLHAELTQSRRLIDEPDDGMDVLRR